MKNVIALFLTAGFVVSAAACTSTSPVSPSAAAGGGASESASGPTIVDIAVGNPDFTTLVAALQRANLVDPFTGPQAYTVFAPTNGAFDAAAAALLGAGSTGLDLVNGLDVSTLSSVLLYHVAFGEQDAASVLDAGSVSMMDSNRATISVVGGAPKIDGANIVATDVIASNGIIHVIDGVLLPPSLR